jgi:hypothetical protein
LLALRLAESAKEARTDWLGVAEIYPEHGFFLEALDALGRYIEDRSSARKNC